MNVDGQEKQGKANNFLFIYFLVQHFFLAVFLAISLLQRDYLFVEDTCVCICKNIVH